MREEVDGNSRPMPDGGVMRVLVIDDEAPIRLLCRVNLEAEGIEVLEAADGRSGLNLAREQHPDVVLLDVMMPGLDGFEVTRRLRSNAATRTTPVILLTARAQASDIARGLAAGADDYVRKPFDARDLADRVDRLLHPPAVRRVDR